MDIKEFNKSYESNKEQIEIYLSQRVKNKEVVEDLTSEVFIKAYKHLDTFDSSKAEYTTWLHTIAKNTFKDYYKTKKIVHKTDVMSNFVDTDNKETFEFIGYSNYNADINLNRNELSIQINKSFNKLKPKFRKMAAMYFISEYSLKEISEILDIPLGTVKGTLNRCREQLQTSLIKQRIRV